MLEGYKMFGIDKCSYINIERGKKISLGMNLCLNDFQISELENGECYKHLGQDEDIGFENILNKERVTAEYLKRVKKIWNSQLYAHNKDYPITSFFSNFVGG